jgi:hypothetical protein
MKQFISWLWNKILIAVAIAGCVYYWWWILSRALFESDIF